MFLKYSHVIRVYLSNKYLLNELIIKARPVTCLLSDLLYKLFETYLMDTKNLSHFFTFGVKEKIKSEIFCDFCRFKVSF